MNASHEALLARYAGLIRKWNPAINLVAPGTLDELENRHLADSERLAEIAPVDDLPWLDIGSGGGLPGLVVAILHPNRPVTLVDSDRRKAAFLQNVIRELDLRCCRAIATRIETLAPASAHHLSARALAPLDRLMPYLDRHLAPDGTAWLMKGRNWRAELDGLGPLQDYEVSAHPSATDPQAAILQFDRKTRG